jgi:F-type H+-transporting ATPase subunit a
LEGHSALLEGNPWSLVAVSGLVIVILVVLSILGTRKMSKVPGPLQNLLEVTVSGLFNFIEGIIGHNGRMYAPFVATLFLYILCLNLIGIIPIPGLRSPTGGLNMTIALALCSFAYVQFQAIRANGPWNYIKHFWGDPWWLGFLMFPIHIIGELAKPLSLSIRLFGNIFGEDKIIVILAGMSPLLISHLPWTKFVPIQFPMMAFGVFTSFIQALIFTVLTAGYLAVMLTHEEEAPVAAESH